MENLFAPWRMTYINGSQGSDVDRECIFCVDDNFKGPDPDRLILFAGKHSIIMMNRFPYNNMHLLVAPRSHTADLVQLSEAQQADLLSKVARSVEILRKDTGPDGFNVGLNLGTVAGAGVADHIHFHIVPRWTGDTNFMTVLADVRVIPEHLTDTYNRLLPSFSQAFRDK